MGKFVSFEHERKKEEAQNEGIAYLFYAFLGLLVLFGMSLIWNWFTRLPWWGWLLVIPAVLAILFLVVLWRQSLKITAAKRMQPSAVWWASVDFEDSAGGSKIRPVILAEVRPTKVDVYYVTSKNKDHEPAHFVRAPDLVEPGVTNWVEYDRVRTINVEALGGYVKHVPPMLFVTLQQKRALTMERRRGAS